MALEHTKDGVSYPIRKSTVDKWKPGEYAYIQLDNPATQGVILYCPYCETPVIIPPELLLLTRTALSSKKVIEHGQCAYWIRDAHLAPIYGHQGRKDLEPDGHFLDSRYIEVNENGSIRLVGVSKGRYTINKDGSLTYLGPPSYE